ncbi:MAG TPA: hypothetical protein K8V08_00450 [Brevibacterium senegalense]|uniref:Uncharacterized protein n=1 Tax=Brevibacterium senegalense TaxID=1033736 RepID=A0A921SMI5_9MICO|nr:hypothetical protein [Brevibacterium senegalense]
MSTALVSSFTAAEAREFTEELKSDYGALRSKIDAAWRGRIWTALGYASWQDYLDAEFVDVTLRPPKELEEQLVAELRAAGMSTRGIAAATELSKDTVHRRLQSAGVANETAEASEPVVGVDGKHYPASIQKRSSGPSRTPDAEPEILDAEIIEEPDTSNGQLAGGDRLAGDLGIEPVTVDMTGHQGLSRDQINRLITELHTSGSAPLPVAKKRAKTLELALSSGHVDPAGLDTDRLDDLAVEVADTMAVLSDLLAVMAGHESGQVTAALGNPDTLGSVEKTATNLSAVTHGNARRARA